MSIKTKKVIAQGNSCEVLIQAKHLESTLSRYGAVKCFYFSSGSDYEYVAHMIFKNYDDAVKACNAAKEHEIKVAYSILTLTPVINSYAPIEILNDKSLIQIFSLLDTTDKLHVEEVCPRWEKLAPYSWFNTTELNLTNRKRYTEHYIDKCIMRTGKVLQHLTLPLVEGPTLSLIKTYCKNLKSIKLPAQSVLTVGTEYFTSTLRKFSKLEHVVLKNIDDSFQLDVFVETMPKELRRIRFSVQRSSTGTIVPLAMDLLAFKNLSVLMLEGFLIGEEALSGITTLEKLNVLSLRRSRVHHSNIEKIKDLDQLRTVLIPNCDIADGLLIKIVKNNPQLQVLNISRNAFLTDRSLLEISALFNLKSLYANHLPMVTLDSMREMLNLEYLDCSLCPGIGNEAVRRILRTSPKLQELDIRGCSLISDYFVEIAKKFRSRTLNGEILKIVTDLNANYYYFGLHFHNPSKKSDEVTEMGSDLGSSDSEPDLADF